VLAPGAQPASAAEDLTNPHAEPAPAWLAAVPIVSVILITILGLWWNGRQALEAEGATSFPLREILNAADSLAVLMWASLGGSLMAGMLAVVRSPLSIRGTVDAWLDGARAMLIAMVILVLAWSLGAVCTSLGTGPWLVDVTSGSLSPRLLPAITFVLAAAISFATGTSWGTMAILIPIVFPLAKALPGGEALDPATAESILLASVSAVLAGAVFGDHCSPISDTTIMSSMASGADHVDHVKTQMPYAITVGIVAIVAGYLPAGWGVNPWLSMLGGGVLLAVLLAVIGKTTDKT